MLPVDERFISGSSFAGFGVRPVGFRRVPPDRVDVMQWATVLYVPVIPLRRYVCEYVEESKPQDDRDEQFVFANAERVPLTFERVARMYAATLMHLIVAFGPWVPAGVYLAGKRNLPVLFNAVAALVLLWPFVFMVLLRMRSRRLLEGTWDPLHAEQVAEDRDEQQDELRSRWQQKHVIPEAVYLALVVAGTVAGVAVALWWQWDMLFGIFGGGVVVLLPVYLIDRWLVSHRDTTGLNLNDMDADSGPGGRRH